MQKFQYVLAYIEYFFHKFISSALIFQDLSNWEKIHANAIVKDALNNQDNFPNLLFVNYAKCQIASKMAMNEQLIFRNYNCRKNMCSERLCENMTVDK
jgi:hypothetical protein